MDDKGGNVESEKTAVAAVMVGEGLEVKWNFLQPLRGHAGRSTGGAH